MWRDNVITFLDGILVFNITIVIFTPYLMSIGISIYIVLYYFIISHKHKHKLQFILSLKVYIRLCFIEH